MAKEPLKSSELWSLYPNPKSINSNPLVSTEERYKKIDDAERLLRSKLGNFGILIGFYLSLPVVTAIAAARIITTLLTTIQPNDIGGAMFAVFTSFAVSSAVILLSYSVYRKANEIFIKHLFNGLPVILTIVTAISLIAWSILTLVDTTFIGFTVGLTATLIGGILLSFILLLVCASKVSANVKVITLLLALIGLLIVGFVVTFQN